MPTISKALQSQIFKRGLKRHLLTKIQRIETNWTKAFIFLIIWFLFMNQTWIKKIDTNSYSYREFFSMRNDVPFAYMAGESSSEWYLACLLRIDCKRTMYNMRFSIDFMISAIIDWRPIDAYLPCGRLLTMDYLYDIYSNQHCAAWRQNGDGNVLCAWHDKHNKYNFFKKFIREGYPFQLYTTRIRVAGKNESRIAETLFFQLMLHSRRRQKCRFATMCVNILNTPHYFKIEFC
jgi:hypothetical protein